MTGTERREAIICSMQKDRLPLSGTKLAAMYGVSRQVIVQDIALIRAAGYDVISTNRGYILNAPVELQSVERVFKVKHSDEQMEEEDNADSMVNRYKLFGSDPKGLYALDQEYAGRVYSAPSLVL